jgi:tetratricopeptide (TPR) repeat protein
MSIFKKLLGTRTLAQQKQEADELFAAGDYGTAKLRYERALERAGQEEAAETAAVKDRINACRDQIARAHIEKALALEKEQELELAMAELNSAAEVAASAVVVAEARRLAEEMERADAREKAAAPAPLSDEEKFVAIAGSWEDEQAEEYEHYGEELRQALLALYDERFQEARQLLEALAAHASDPHYLHYEVGRARLLTGEVESGAQALHLFLSSIGPEEGGETRLATHLELARIAEQAGDLDGAIAQLQTAIEALPRDPRPYLLMGNFLRQHGHAQEAVEVLESGLRALDQANPDTRTIQEIGLCYADLGQDQKAIGFLERVVEQLTARQQFDLPPEAAVVLAKLHDKVGNKGRAADLYVLLSSGSDRANYFLYYSEAGRLLAELRINDEARKMLQRATEFAPDDETVRQTLKERLQALDAVETEP